MYKDERLNYRCLIKIVVEEGRSSRVESRNADGLDGDYRGEK